MRNRRRKSPLWVRESTHRELHGIAGRLVLEQHHHELSRGQEWLWEAVVSELEWRFLHPGPQWEWCCCSLCFVDTIDHDQDLGPECPF